MGSEMCIRDRAYLDASTSSSFHKHTVIRRCECGPDITVQGEAIAVLLQYLAK